jgi:hypothetical protein
VVGATIRQIAGHCRVFAALLDASLLQGMTRVFSIL